MNLEDTVKQALEQLCRNNINLRIPPEVFVEIKQIMMRVAQDYAKHHEPEGITREELRDVISDLKPQIGILMIRSNTGNRLEYLDKVNKWVSDPVILPGDKK